MGNSLIGLLLAQTDGSEFADLEGLTPADWIQAGLIFLTAIVASRLLQMVITRVLSRGDGNAVTARLIGRFLGALLVIVGFIYALGSLDVQLGPLLGALGIGGLAFAFAAQSLLENFFGSILLQARRPFRIGDQVTVSDGITGVVEDINFRVVVMRTFDGERVYVPAADVVQAAITNVSVGGPWRTSLAVGVSYSADLRTAQAVLLGAVAGADGVLDDPAPAVWFDGFGDSSLDFSLLFWHAPEMAARWRVRSAVGIDVMEALTRAGIEVPFPQRTLWFGDSADARDGDAADGTQGAGGPGVGGDS